MWYIARVPKPCIMALQKCMLHFSPWGGKTVVIRAGTFNRGICGRDFGAAATHLLASPCHMIWCQSRWPFAYVGIGLFIFMLFIKVRQYV